MAVLQYFAQCLLSVIAVLVVIVFSTPGMLLDPDTQPRAALTFSVHFCSRRYRLAVLDRWRDVRRDQSGDQAIRRESRGNRVHRRVGLCADAQSVTRSPIFISFSEVLVGMSTIRSYGDSARFMRKLFHELDQNT